MTDALIRTTRALALLGSAAAWWLWPLAAATASVVVLAGLLCCGGLVASVADDAVIDEPLVFGGKTARVYERSVN